MEVLDMLNTRIDGRILSLSFLSKKSERDIHDFKGLHCASFLQSLELKKKKKFQELHINLLNQQETNTVIKE